ncbi:MAG: hemolysin family protein [Blastocatellia bacterium]|nr:hemolysin family protein [Blastocatellia bacterium]MCX7753082.1 hemolysin family protein [Blastocatellia bacterium]MDW8169398.1 hemolysin family protein [Acidobacteriota bacterium]MDW8256465.1 hemolysin family protein [Acidobacteriota bacterium]
MDDSSVIAGFFRLGLIVFLVLANGFFVASEFALVAVRRSWVETQAAKGDRRARVLLPLLDHLDDYIAATQLGITIASLALGWLGEPILARMIAALLERLTMGLPADVLGRVGAPSAWLGPVAVHSIAIALAFAIITFLHVVAGELAPKTLALERAPQVALRIARPMAVFYRLFFPFVRLLNRSGLGLVRLLRIPPSRGHGGMYAEEIQHLINLSREQGLLEAEEHQLISNVFNFTTTTAREAMRPRADMVAIEASLSFEEILRVFEKTGYSRLPVYRGELDNIIGILHGKDLLRYLRQPERFRLEAVLHRPLFVPDTAPLDEVLRQMRQRKSHLALVVDEYGAIEGLITLEDVLEELVGEIADEHDLEEERIRIRPDGTILVEGSVTVREVNRRLHLSVPESDEYTTLAGFVMTRLGKLPLPGDRVVHNGVAFIVEKVEGRRLTQLRLESVASDAARGNASSDRS